MTKECEKIAEMMIRHSLATGHGDTVEDLLSELEEQIKELQARAVAADEAHENALDLAIGWRKRSETAESERDRFRELYAKEAHAKMVLSERAEKAEAELALTDKEADATSDLLSAAVDKCRALEAELAQARKALEDIVSFYDGPTEAKRPDFFERLMNRARNALNGEPK